MAKSADCGDANIVLFHQEFGKDASVALVVAPFVAKQGDGSRRVLNEFCQPINGVHQIAFGIAAKRRCEFLEISCCLQFLALSFCRSKFGPRLVLDLGAFAEFAECPFAEIRFAGEWPIADVNENGNAGLPEIGDQVVAGSPFVTDREDRFPCADVYGSISGVGGRGEFYAILLEQFGVAVASFTECR